ncbi:NAD-dependent epimerase/dehydratase family protein [Glycomyces sp. NPDC047010]|uniref:NAD-dependent epimerase/dehydratase family protein n=1 Tax=Glycomyces sp. NPDC047010 TaxID=3155023 RepID=UPI0033C21954
MDMCIIGGSRYFGRRLVELLLGDGHAVTVVNRGSVPAPPGAAHVIADRDEERALRAALGSRRFDVVIDQVCYTPLQAAVARRVFEGRTSRYLMTSTVEVYDPRSSSRIAERPPGSPVPETAVDPADWPVDPALPWTDPAFADAHYGEGKRQAEAVLSRAAFDFASVRCAHVLGGTDFTGRLAHYLDRTAAGTPIAVHPVNRPASFIHHHEIAEVLHWAATESFTGPLNAASTGELDVTDLCAAIEAAGTGTPHLTATDTPDPSPYAFDRYYAMDTHRATTLGFRFSETRTWLPEVIAEALKTPASEAV